MIKRLRRILLIFPLILLCCLQLADNTPANAQSDIWVSGYYAGWMQGCGGDGYLRSDQIDFGALTHVIHFSLMPNPDGSLDS